MCVWVCVEVTKNEKTKQRRADDAHAPPFALKGYEVVCECVLKDAASRHARVPKVHRAQHNGHGKRVGE